MRNMRKRLLASRKRLKRPNAVTLGSTALTDGAGPTRAASRKILSILLLVLLLPLTAFCQGARVSSFEDEGDCYTLVNRYLKLSNVPFIIDDALKNRSCNWNFKGNTIKDFEKWCSQSGLKCGGNPYFVGYDSLYYNGVFQPRSAVEFQMRTEYRQDSIARHQQYVTDSLGRLQWVRDSVSSVPIPLKFATIEYLELSRATAERLGFRYSDWIGSARFFQYNDLFSVSIQAQEYGDTSFVYRQYESWYDTTLSVFWGGKRDRIKSSSITSSGIVSENFETETYGLTFAIEGMRYSYIHSTDYEHEINGTGKLVPGANDIFGSYQAMRAQEYGLPVLARIPVIGALFRQSVAETEWRYIFIRVRVADSREELLKGVEHVTTRTDTTGTRNRARYDAESTYTENSVYP